MENISNFGKDFLLLALRINKHIKGYVDFYYDPDELRQIVENESILPPNKLLRALTALIQQLGAQGYNEERERYLKKLLPAMKTSIEILNDTEISIKDQYSRIYDIDLQPVNEFELDSLKNEVDKAYTGHGSLENRMAKLRVNRRVPESKVLKLFKKALSIVRKQTYKLFISFLYETVGTLT